MAKLGSNVEACSICNEKVYPIDKFVIEKLVLHKNCFKCKHCDRKLSLTNFAAVNGTVYCKVHYLKLFRESGGKYDRAFGDGGFQKKSNAAYTPGQFTGVGKQVSAVPGHVSTGNLQMSPVITINKGKAVEVSKLDDEDDDDTELEGESDAGDKPNVKDMLKKYEATLRDASSGGSDAEDSSPKPSRGSPGLAGNLENRMKWLTGVSSTHIKKHSEVDETSGGTVAERKAAYLAGLQDSSSASPDRSQKIEASSKREGSEERGKNVSEEGELQGNLYNRLKWSENLSSQHIKTHSEIDTSSGGTAEERKRAYLASISSGGSNFPSSSPSRHVSRSISEKMKVFSSPSPSNSTPNKHLDTPHPGRIDEKLRSFVEAASASSSPSSAASYSPAVELSGNIEEKLRMFDVAAHGSPADKEEGRGESRERTDALVSQQQSSTPPKMDAGQAGAPIRSFNEGASAGLRRTPSWLRQQRALEETARASSSAGAIDEANSALEPDSSVSSAVINAAMDVLTNHSSEHKTVKSEDGDGSKQEEEEDEEEPTTPVKVEEGPPPGSIMKRAGSFKKDKAATPAEKRVVRFGHAEIHSLPESPKTPDVTDGSVVRGSVGGHSATKGSALAAYLKVVENSGGGIVRKRPLEELEHTSHADSPPPPILSPGSRSPNSSLSSIASEAAAASVDLNGGVLDGDAADGLNELISSALLPPPAVSLTDGSKEGSDSIE